MTLYLHNNNNIGICNYIHKYLCQTILLFRYDLKIISYQFITISDMDLGEPPAPTSDEDIDTYFRRNKDYWLLKADDMASAEGLEVSGGKLKKAAKKMAQEFWDGQQMETK